MIPEDSHRDLAKRLSTRDKDAIAILYNAYVDRIYRSVFNQVDRNEPVAQDIVQETFIAAIGSAKNFDGHSSLFTWLYGIANNKVADHYRKKKRHDKLFLPKTDSVDDILDKAVDPLDLEEECISNTNVREILNNMPLHYQQAILMKYLDKMSVAEIASVMNKSSKSVEGILSRARKELIETINKMEYGHNK